MKVMVRPRGWGKTTTLILIAERTKKPILVATERSKRLVKMRAKELGVRYIACFSVNDIINLKHKDIVTNFSKDFLIDEFGYVFDEFLRRYGIKAVLGTTTYNG